MPVPAGFAVAGKMVYMFMKRQRKTGAASVCGGRNSFRPSETVFSDGLKTNLRIALSYAFLSKRTAGRPSEKHYG